jgi:hypothetical protein
VSELDALYLSLLRYGLLLIREALWRGNAEWAKAETEHLHEIPTLIGSANVHRHLDYLQRMRVVYLEFVQSADLSDLNTRVESYYRPVWKQMADFLCRHAEEAKRRGLSEYTPLPSSRAEASGTEAPGAECPQNEIGRGPLPP